jgi:hypothetical protein
MYGGCGAYMIWYSMVWGVDDATTALNAYVGGWRFSG